MYHQIAEETRMPAFVAWVSMIDKRYNLSANIWLRALYQTFVHQSFIDAFKQYPQSKNKIAKAIIVLLALAYRGLIIWIIVATILNSKKSEGNKYNLFIQTIIAAIAGFITNILGNMGNISDRDMATQRHEELLAILNKSEAEREKANGEREKAESEREKAESEREKANARHHEVIGTLAKMSGDETTVEKFKSDVFHEHRATFVNELSTMNQQVIDHLSSMNMVNVNQLDVMYRYDHVDQATPDDLRHQ